MWDERDPVSGSSMIASVESNKFNLGWGFPSLYLQLCSTFPCCFSALLSCLSLCSAISLFWSALFLLCFAVLCHYALLPNPLLCYQPPWLWSQAQFGMLYFFQLLWPLCMFISGMGRIGKSLLIETIKCFVDSL